MHELLKMALLIAWFVWPVALSIRLCVKAYRENRLRVSTVVRCVVASVAWFIPASAILMLLFYPS